MKRLAAGYAKVQLSHSGPAVFRLFPRKLKVDSMATVLYISETRFMDFFNEWIFMNLLCHYTKAKAG